VVLSKNFHKKFRLSAPDQNHNPFEMIYKALHM
jgi:hypothetical protein